MVSRHLPIAKGQGRARRGSAPATPRSTPCKRGRLRTLLRAGAGVGRGAWISLFLPFDTELVSALPTRTRRVRRLV
jgi:hypothetical protein